MIVHTSALVAIVLGESERASYLERITQAPRRLLSAASYVELAIVVDSRRDPVLSRSLDQLLAALEIEVVPVTASQAAIARAAHRDFGRGSGHPARLSLGDCFSHALAKDTDEPLLWTGDDFSHTDVRRP